MLPRSTVLFTLASVVVGICLGADFCDNDDGDRSEEIESFTNGANDVVVVVQPDGTLKATDFHVQGQFQSNPAVTKFKMNLRFFVMEKYPLMALRI